MAISRVADGDRREPRKALVAGEREGKLSPPVERKRDEVSLGAIRDSLLRGQRIGRRKNHTEEQREIIRRNLIRARITAGLDQVAAAGCFGYANSTQLSLIETGARKVPDGTAFLVDAARAYDVSVDFLLGLSPCMEPDGLVLRERAMLREMEGITHGIAATLAASLAEHSARSYPLMREYQGLLDKVERAGAALDVMRTRHGFDDAPGGAPLMRAMQEMDEAAQPLRAKLQKYCSIEAVLADLRAGRAVLPEHLESIHTEEPVQCAEPLMGSATSC